jgi:molybdopterin-guanine dinucleotide biosynthesis protein A
MALLGLVLAGGQARRMGGGDKPLLDLAGRPILDHVLARIAPQCDGLLLSANGDPARFSRWDITVVADEVMGFPGPLAGILAGLDWAAAHRPDVEALVSVAGDTPFIPADLVARLKAAAQEAGLPLAVAVSGGRRHPVVGLWTVSLRRPLRHALIQEGQRGVGAVAARLGCAGAEWSARPVDPFFNVNTPEELAEAERLARLTR